MRKHLRQLWRCFLAPDEGFEVHALLGDRGEPGLREELAGFEREGLRVQWLPELGRALRPGRDWSAYRALKRALRERAPDIVHTHSAKAGFLGRLAASACGVRRIVHTPHVFPFLWTRGITSSFYLALERYAAAKCHALVCVGDGQKDAALARGLAPAEKLVVIRNGVALPPAPDAARRLAERARLGLPADAPAVGMVARLAPQKGVGAFLEAAKLVLKRRPEALFVLLGDGPLEAEVRARAAALGLDRQRMRILGHVEDAEARYPAFDALALSSLYEGLPYVLLEALAWGVPVVATDVLGSRDVIAHEETGLLARSGEPADLAAQLERLLGDATLRARLGEAGRRRVGERFALETFLEGHRRLYRAGPA
ncbi:MAG: glycosyltransferase family 4 protein [Planctomycetota bacterium]|nr:glycosyltransferase family 4 protein [Planctomycetota bacterium]